MKPLFRQLNRETLRLALPNILANLSVPLVGVVDLALAGRMDTPQHGPARFIGTIGLAAMVFSYLYWSFGFLRMGTTGQAAQAYGRKDRAEGAAVLGRGLLAALAGGVLLILLQGPIGWLTLRLLNAQPALEALTLDYIHVRIYAAPATLGLYVLQGWLQGMQNARYVLASTLSLNLLNVAFSLYFVHSQGMLTDGLALGTVLAQWAGLGITAVLLARRYPAYRRALAWRPILQVSALVAFFRLNADIFLRTVGLLTIFALFRAQSAAMGTGILAANLLLMELKTLAAFAIDGFAYATESLTGRYAGAGQPRRLRISLRLGFAWGAGLGLLFSLLFALFPGPLLRVFTDDPAIVQQAGRYLWWLVAYTAVAAVAFIWDGVFIGLTASRAMRNSMLVALFIGFVPAFLLAPRYWGNDGLWLAMLLSVVARGASQTWMARGVLPDRLSGKQDTSV